MGPPKRPARIRLPPKRTALQKIQSPSKAIPDGKENKRVKTNGNQSDTRNGDKADTRSGNQEDVRSGNPEDTRSGDQQNTRSGDKADTRRGNQEDTRSGNQEDTRSGDQQDTRNGNRGDNGQQNTSALDHSLVEASLNSLTNLSCNIAHVTLLHLSLHPDNLQQCCKDLESSLKEKASTLIKSKKRSSNTNTSFLVTAELLPGIRMTPYDADSLLIEVFRQSSIDDNDTENLERKLLFKCLFTSCGSTGRGLQFKPGDDDSPKNLPVVIWYGKSQVWNLFQPILEAKLQCNFHSVHFSSVHMQIFTGLWLQQEAQRSGQQTKEGQGVCIDYQFPVKTSQKKESPVMSAEIDFGQWKQKFKDADNSLDDSVILKQVLRTIWQEALDSYKATFKLDLARAVFLKTRTRTCVISSKGRLKLRKGTKLSEFQLFFSQLTRIVELR